MESGYRVIQVEGNSRNWMVFPTRLFKTREEAQHCANNLARLSIGETYEVEWWNERLIDCAHEYVDWYCGPMGYGPKFYECRKCGARHI